MAQRFARVSATVAHLTGHYLTFLGATAIILLWALTGPFFAFSQTWQLVINTGTTIITFLMVFLIQNTQNRDARAMHLKLDELIRSIAEADNDLIRAEDETDEELTALKRRYEALCDEHAELQGRVETLQDTLASRAPINASARSSANRPESVIGEREG